MTMESGGQKLSKFIRAIDPTSVPHPSAEGEGR